MSQAKVDQLRGKTRSVVLDDIVVEQMLKLNSYSYRGKSYAFDLEDAHGALRRLSPTPDKLKGLRGTNQDLYDLMVLGTTISKAIEGDSKSYSFKYIDWETPENNVFHVTAEMSVERTASTATRRCDIVCFVNGIPFIVIENKCPTESLKKADSQRIGYQNEDNIPQLFHYAQLLVSMKRQEARYATVGTPHKFWQIWRDEEDRDADISGAINQPLTEDEKKAVFSGNLADARTFFEELAAAGKRSISEQDRAIHALCRPERLLDLVRRFTVFDGGVRKIARHQQFFSIRTAITHLKGRREGGVIWHTQGSGKSLTMVMLGDAHLP